MIDFISAVKNVLDENNKTTVELFKDKIISENTFYKYRKRYPNLKTLIKIANYLEVSVDYLFELKDENLFVPYSANQEGFYNNLIALIKSANISCRKFCKDLHFSRDNVLRWKKGTQPSVQVLLEIAKYFNCFIDDLLIKGK